MTETKLDGIEACVFDAYGTLFDVNAAAQHCAAELGDQWQPLANLWRLRQIEYSWLRGCMREYVDFWQLTGDALDFAMENLGISDPALRQRLMDLYLKLDVYGEVPAVLAHLKASGMKTAILSNGSPDMLAAAVRNAGIGGHLDAVLSVDELRTFKPAPEVYQLAVDRLGVPASAISFQSSNAWDAHAASNFGFRVVWINRFGQAPERLPGRPDVELETLGPLPTVVGAD
jgi:2-haloacid dehalogenase